MPALWCLGSGLDVGADAVVEFEQSGERRDVAAVSGGVGFGRAEQGRGAGVVAGQEGALGGQDVGRGGDRPLGQVRGDALVERIGVGFVAVGDAGEVVGVRAGEHVRGAHGECGGGLGALREGGAQWEGRDVRCG